MSIDSLGRHKVTGKGLKSQKKHKSKAGTSSRATLNGAAMILAGACLLAPDYGFAEDSDLAAEVERLRKELGETKKENEQLKKAVANTNPETPANAATAQSAPATATVATAEPPKKEEKSFVDEPKNLSEVVA